MTGIKTIDQYAARLLMVSFFLPANWQVYTIMGVSTWFIIRALATKTLVRKTDYLWALLFSCLFLIYFLSIPFTPVEYREYLLHICEHKVSLFFAPFVMALVGLVFRKAIIGELQYFVYGCFLSCLAGNLDYIYHYYFIPIGLHGLSHVDYRIIFEKCTGIHPTYMGMFISFSICIIFLSDVYS